MEIPKGVFENRLIRKDYTNQQFGDLHVEKYYGTSTATNISYWICKCICEKLVIRPCTNLKKIRSCGCRLRKTGKECPRWKGYEEIPSNYWGTLVKNAECSHREFTITQKYIWELFIKQNRKCVLSGLPLYFAVKGTTASLDRIDSKKGYIKGNVQWVHKEINKMKTNLAQEEFIKFCKLITEHQVNKVKI